MSARPGAARDADGPAGSVEPVGRAYRPRAELLLVLGVSLGQSAVWAVVSLADTLSRGPLRSQPQTLNPTQNVRPLFDLIEQLLSIAFPLVPVLLALYLMGPGVLRRIGLDVRRPGFDAGTGALLALAIGLPGLGLYFAGVALGITTPVHAAGLAPQWYAVPVLVLSALRAALQEEVIVVAFLVSRLRDARWGWPAVVVTSALLRGSYHLYQGFGPAIGNAVMGVVFALFYRRFGRVAPLVVAHFLLDLVSFVGYYVVQAVAPGLLP
ncbi:CPBP family intramembrane glutamic endopeptidase [Amnibacterium endophyticum]|uniref:CPBP family intramembrane glutamic endopeptidase n=1 Tax=Amnibacterium endophyticum TaxID=2109337 RepID=A0ABW4LAE1_9MICO